MRVSVAGWLIVVQKEFQSCGAANVKVRLSVSRLTDSLWSVTRAEDGPGGPRAGPGPEICQPATDRNPYGPGRILEYCENEINDASHRAQLQRCMHHGFTAKYSTCPRDRRQHLFHPFQRLK